MPLYPNPTVIPGAGSTQFTAGSVVFADSNGVMNQDNTKVYWDDTNFLEILGARGTYAPTTGELHVLDTSANSVRGIVNYQNDGASTNGARVIFRKARGTPSAPTTIVTGDTLGNDVFEGYDGSNFLQMASVQAVAEGTIAATRVPTSLRFSTATDAAPSVLTETVRMNVGTQYLWVSPAADNTTEATGIAFGSSRDLTMYRSGPNGLTLGTGAGGRANLIANRLIVNNSAPANQERLLISPSSAPVGAAAAQEVGVGLTTTTATIATTAQTGDLSYVSIKQLTVASTPASTVIPDLSGLRVKGPVTSGANASATRTQAVLVEPGADATVGLVVRQNSGSQSAKLIDFQNSAGTSLAQVSSGGTFVAPDGTTVGPGFRFTNETTLGLYRISAGILGFSANAELARISSSLLQLSAGVMLTLNNDGSAAQDIVAGTTNGIRLATGATQKLGFWGTAPVVRSASAAVTNNVTAGGTTDTVDNVLAAAVDTSAASLVSTRNATYQLARKVKEMSDALRLYGIFT